MHGETVKKMNLIVRGRRYLPPNLGTILAFTGEDYENHKNPRPVIWFTRQDITMGLLGYTS
jgi:hypothetical protein